MQLTLNQSFAVLAAALTLSSVNNAWSEEIYKQVDAQGNVTYSNKPIKGGKKVELPQLSTVPIPKTSPKKIESTPVSAAPTMSARETLLDAIVKEQKALDEARAAAKEGADKPEVFQTSRTVIGKDGKPTVITETGRNVAAYEEKMKQLNAEVALHEKNLAGLNAELAALDKK